MTDTARQVARDAGPASDGQKSFITSLLADRDTTGTAYEGWTPDWSRATFSLTSTVIDTLKTLPYKARKQAEPGFYVLGDKAFKVQSNKAGTGTYALVWAGSSWEYDRGAARHLADLVPMTAEDAAKIGLASGRCIACCRVLGGASLTSRVAAVVGYGEICAGHNGWSFPKGAAAQRAFLTGNGVAPTVLATDLARGQVILHQGRHVEVGQVYQDVEGQTLVLFNAPVLPAYFGPDAEITTVKGV